jgi:hypothetical protein
MKTVYKLIVDSHKDFDIVYGNTTDDHFEFYFEEFDKARILRILGLLKTRTTLRPKYDEDEFTTAIFNMKNDLEGFDQNELGSRFMKRYGTKAYAAFMSCEIPEAGDFVTGNE